ncbi:MAG: 7-cyano-7-deazaguanine synthase QueC [Pseudomonadota bacterium]|nr:7-cyano-7-deazaguanine synthase QueC [Pseudomonadota bacterium]
MSNKKAIVLLSGGLDSATCLALATNKNLSCYALSFDYGQRSKVELNSATKIANNHNVVVHKIVNLQDLGSFGGSTITDHSLSMQISDHKPQIASSYVPARNTVFLAIALSWAEAIDADYIYIGVHNDDRSCYPDCRPEYIEKFQYMANVANKKGVEGKPIKIEAPLLNKSKAEIITLGTKLGLDYSKTVTCYQADEEGRACGKCLSCCTRKSGFAMAGIPDPTIYQ